MSLSLPQTCASPPLRLHSTPRPSAPLREEQLTHPSEEHWDARGAHGFRALLKEGLIATSPFVRGARASVRDASAHVRSSHMHWHLRTVHAPTGACAVVLGDMHPGDDVHWVMCTLTLPLATHSRMFQTVSAYC